VGGLPVAFLGGLAKRGTTIALRIIRIAMITRKSSIPKLILFRRMSSPSKPRNYCWGKFLAKPEGCRASGGLSNLLQNRELAIFP
jgi:hypothetical protein